MYAPSEPEETRTHVSSDRSPWHETAPAPIRWAGPSAPQGTMPLREAAPPPYAPYPPMPLPVRTSAPPPTPSGALLCIGSFAVSVALYTWLLGLPLGLGITVLLLVHELGHYIVIRAKGLPASLPVFIPFIGAYVAMRRWPSSVGDDAVIALAGPLAGAFSALGCIALYQATGASFFVVLALLGYALNLLNLVPILPLDGGRVAAAITRWISPLAFGAIVWYAVVSQSILLLVLVAFFGLPALVRSFATGRYAAFYRISFPARLFIAVVYLLLAAALFGGMLATGLLVHPFSLTVRF